MDINVTINNTEENKLDISWTSNDFPMNLKLEAWEFDSAIKLLRNLIKEVKKADTVNFINAKSLNDILLTISEGKLVMSEYPEVVRNANK